MSTLGFFEGIMSPSHWLIILIIALLIFGHRLPEVARNMGKSVVEFKKGLKGVEEDANRAAEPAPRREALPPRDAAYHDDRRGAPRDEHVEVSQPPTSGPAT